LEVFVVKVDLTQVELSWEVLIIVLGSLNVIFESTLEVLLHMMYLSDDEIEVRAEAFDVAAEIGVLL
jgi:hypothetical protein